MAYYKREEGRGGDRGGRGFGGGGFKPRGGFGGGRAGGFGGDRPMESFDAVCAECGKDTTVPFRPNGRKPVLCRDCFKKDEGGSRGGEFRPRPSFGDRPQRSAPEIRTWGTSDAKIDEINAKLDRIIRTLEAKKESEGESAE